MYNEEPFGTRILGERPESLEVIYSGGNILKPPAERLVNS